MSGKLVVGGEKGGLRLWELGVWDDNEETITVGRGASADVLATVPEGVGKEQMLAVGMDDGFVRFVGMGGKRPKVVGEVSHDEVEGVLGLSFDVGGRMCSGGGTVCKIWEESLGIEKDEEDEEQMCVNGKRRAEGSSVDEDSEADENHSEEEEKPRKKKRKKRKGNKGGGKSGGQHVIAFKGMD